MSIIIHDVIWCSKDMDAERVVASNFFVVWYPHTEENNKTRRKARIVKAVVVDVDVVPAQAGMERL